MQDYKIILFPLSLSYIILITDNWLQCTNKLTRYVFKQLRTYQARISCHLLSIDTYLSVLMSNIFLQCPLTPTNSYCWINIICQVQSCVICGILWQTDPSTELGASDIYYIKLSISYEKIIKEKYLICMGYSRLVI